MPPMKRAGSASASASDGESPPPVMKAKAKAAPKPKVPKADDDGEEPKAKKPRKAPVPVVPLGDAPTNLEFPASLEFDRPSATSGIRLAAWNVCGLRAAEKKGGLAIYAAAEDADVLMFTETKLATDPAIAHLTSRYPFRYFGADPKKGYAGVACLSKIEPLSVVYGVPSDTIGGYQDITKGRLITLEFPTTYVLIGYSPNAGAGLKEMPRKVEWNAAFEIYLRQLDGVKPVVWCGDQNVVPTEQDIRNWKTNYNKSAGVTQIEIDAYNRQLNPPAESGHGKLTDAWRKLHPDTVGVYSYYSYRFACRSKGIGYRLDQFIVSDRLLPSVTACEIRSECFGASDHLPVMLDLSVPL